jgi:hypothetical protein
MSDTKEQIAILSGRYTIPHPAHAKTVRREAANYKRLIVYIVDSPDRPYPAAWVKEYLEMVCETCGNVEVRLDPCHFGYATKEDIARLPEYDVFLVVNPKVAIRLMSLGVNYKMIPRTEGYDASKVQEAVLAEGVRMWGQEQGK